RGGGGVFFYQKKKQKKKTPPFLKEKGFYKIFLKFFL
ncbi:hypothetical protein CGSSa00_13528, partial [Staphylococcus aureus subsp. aureus CGS00]